MQEVGLSPETLENRLIEVWNKVDLVKDEAAFKAKVQAAQESSPHPIVLMSCTEGYNKDLFLA
jgi:50S ribosomal subunit-associated GTPase HflX